MTQVDDICRQLDPGLRRDDERKKDAMTRGVVFLPNRAPRNCKISWVVPGEGDPQGGGGICYSYPPHHSVVPPSMGGELFILPTGENLALWHKKKNRGDGSFFVRKNGYIIAAQNRTSPNAYRSSSGRRYRSCERKTWRNKTLTRGRT